MERAAAEAAAAGNTAGSSVQVGGTSATAADRVAGIGASLSTVEQEIEEMRRRLRELEEADRVPAVAPAAGAVDEDSAVEEPTMAEKIEVDARSIYVGNVDYACLPEEIQQHFQDCGIINRVTILTDSFGQPKGFAFVEFHEAEAVQNAILLNGTELCGRPLKVCQKRTNIPGMSQHRGRRPYYPFDPSYSTYGKVPRFRRPPGYRPY